MMSFELSWRAEPGGQLCGQQYETYTGEYNYSTWFMKAYILTLCRDERYAHLPTASYFLR